MIAIKDESLKFNVYECLTYCEEVGTIRSVLHVSMKDDANKKDGVKK